MTDGDSRPGQQRLDARRAASAGAFIIRYLRPRAAMTALSIVSIAAISAARWRWAVGLATRTASDARTSPIGRRPFITSVEPVETRSTIASARPSRGATSTAPEIGMTSTAMPALGEEAAGGVRVGRRDAQAGELLDRLVRACRSGRRRRGGTGRSRAIAEARQLGAGLGEEVDAGDRRGRPRRRRRTR